MMDSSLSRGTLAIIDTLVERVARKAGYTGGEDTDYEEMIQARFKNAKKDTDFAEEIRTYLKDGLLELIKEGHSEEDAVKITVDKFDEAELSETFDEFVDAFDKFGMEDEYMSDKYEAVGLFYAGFTLMGMVLGAFLGYLIGQSIINTFIGFGVGLFIGASLGLISNAIIALRTR